MKRVNIKCPYCGSRALLRPASVVYGERAADPTAPYYVCARYPACDSYVAAHRRTKMPMGTLADETLRRKRIEAHAAFGRLWEDGLMSKKHRTQDAGAPPERGAALSGHHADRAA